MTMPNVERITSSHYMYTREKMIRVLGSTHVRVFCQNHKSHPVIFIIPRSPPRYINRQFLADLVGSLSNTLLALYPYFAEIFRKPRAEKRALPIINHRSQ